MRHTSPSPPYLTGERELGCLQLEPRVVEFAEGDPGPPAPPAGDGLTAGTLLRPVAT